jgi:5-methylcytosine-specific restriction endonuclease McrA
MPSRTFLRSRANAFARQNGQCFYCSSPMWLADHVAFATRYRITKHQALLFRCTGEHLQERQSGGNDSASNVVAACHFCNRTRHHFRPTKAPTPVEYKRHVEKQMSKGRWPGARVVAP